MSKVISILQPWASLIVLGHKKIETRSWNTKYKGELLIHASCGKQYKKIHLSDPFWNEYHLLFARHGMPPIEHLPFGAIIGKVNLIETYSFDKIKLETIINHSEDLYGIPDRCSMTKWGRIVDKEKAFGNYSSGRFGWLLSDPVLFDKPIPAKGQLGIWNWE